MDMSDLQTQRGMAGCAESYHTTDSRVYRLIEPPRKNWAIAGLSCIALVPENREYLHSLVSSQIVTSVEQ